MRVSLWSGTVEVDGKCGFIDKTGRMIIPATWDLNEGGADDISFRNGRVQVAKDGRLGLVDKTGKVIVAPEWDKLERQPPYFNNGCFALRFAHPSMKMPTNGEIMKELNGRVTPEKEAKQKLWRSYQPAEAAWFDRDGKMIWHSAL